MLCFPMEKHLHPSMEVIPRNRAVWVELEIFPKAAFAVVRPLRLILHQMARRVIPRLTIPQNALRIACGLMLAVAVPLSTTPILYAASDTPSAMDPKQVEGGIKKFFEGKPPEEVVVSLLEQAKR